MVRDLARRPPSGLVAGWVFDHGDVRDIGPLNHDLTTVNSPTVTRFLDLNGTNQRAYVNDSSDFTFGNGSTDSPFSVFAWVNMVDATKFRLAQKYSTGQTEWVFGTDGSDKIRMTVQDNSTGGRLDKISNGSVTSSQNSWSSIAGTYDGSATVGGMTVYHDGAAPTQTTSTSGSYTAMEDTTSTLDIGYLETSASYANGAIDTLLIFNRELTAAEVANLHQLGRS